MTAYTVYKGALLPAVAGDSGVWGTGQNTATFPVFDSALGGYAAISVSNANVTLNASQDGMAILRVTGTLSGNVQITSACQGFKYVENLTTGSYTLTITNGAGTPLALPQGVGSVVIIDATNGARLGNTTVITAAGVASLSAALSSTIMMATNQAVTASGASLTINASLGWDVDLTLSANVTSMTLSNLPSAGSYVRVTLNISSTGSYNITGWPGTTRWPGGAAPTITSGNGKLDTIILQSSDSSNFRGFVAGQDLS